MPKDNKWAESGMVEWDGGSLAWRTLDAQYWGVPQRRKRIFLVADFGGFTAGEILFVEQGLHGDSSESEGEREETAADVGTSIDSAIGVDIYNNKITGNKVTALTTNNTSTSTAPKVMTSINSASETLTPWDVQSNRIQSIDGKAATLYGGAGQGTHNGAVFDTRQIDTASGFKYRQGAKAGGIGWQNGKAPTLELSQNCAVLRMRSGCAGGGKGPLVSENKSLTLATSNDQTLFTLDRASFNQGRNAQYNFKIGQDEIADTLVARGPGAVAILGDKDDLQDSRESPTR
jgi:DNA (cytosine-5)-methyltransferase 1